MAAGPVLSVAQLLDDKQLKQRDFVIDIDHPEAGRRKTVGLPWKIGGVQRPEYRRSPLIGESNEYVFKELLDLTDEDIARLKEKGVIE